MDATPICPYTGLRSFTEEESLYFKGRDQQVDQITELLEQNKFLMVTGASGDGKSSLIYAGLVPNARAGFFKSKFTNWVVVDFRPERSPVTNMARSLGEKLGRQPDTIETELRRGFSSLIDLYTNSEFYVDEEDEYWRSFSPEQQRDKKRKAANLMILVDQFEEFFTNPENFHHEAPSPDSQIVVNLVLETARIAIKRRLPVYVVCTMRSDYIGQCAAFRGLPEYIGFSQFFVPRLKRKDFKQVIEEPAILSGNRISQRLIERLVYDLAEGVDQLPILQHALSQVWLAADQGREQMDLLHYAMVGGMPQEDLPDEDQPRFLKWFQTLPEAHKKYYRETGLHKVIQIHASLLYENAWEYFNKQYPGTPITQQLAKRVIALTFSCLTKIDNSRAVRNRMSLAEITDIVNVEGLTPDRVGAVLNVYREEGNAFIRPFKTSDPETHALHEDTVLDITHESLIRNWQKLNEWANQEFEFYSMYLDFRKQLDRWLQSGKSNAFLLPIGPLSFFETWYERCRPNAGWIRRYMDVGPEANVKRAEEILTDIREFLKRSARKVTVTRAFMRYGPQRIAIGLAIVIMLILSGFYWYDAEQKQNDRVIGRLMDQTEQLVASQEVNNNFKAIALLLKERYQPGALGGGLEDMDPGTRLTLGIETYKQLLIFNKHDKSAMKKDLIASLQKAYDALQQDKADPALKLQEVNRFTTLLAYDNYFNPDDNTARVLAQFANEGYELAHTFLSNKSLYGPSISIEMNYAVQQWLTFGKVTREMAERLLNRFSPFVNEAAAAMFEVYYPQGSYEINGRVPNNFNGGYHTLASLYAAIGDVNAIIQSFASIQQSGQNDYFIGSLFNNYNHILAIIYQFGHQDKVQPMINWLASNYASDTPLTIYRNSVIRAGYWGYLAAVNINKELHRSYRGYFFPNLCLSSNAVFNALADDYEKLILEIPNRSERNYLLAINKKRRAMFTHKREFDRGQQPDLTALNQLLTEAVNHYRQVEPAYLDETISITIPYYGDGVRNREYTRRHLFIYPDYMEGWFSRTYHSDLFFNYIARENLFAEFYRTPEDLAMIHWWVAKANERKPFADASAYDNHYPLPDEVLENIVGMIASLPYGKNFDLNLVHLVLANRKLAKGDTVAGLQHCRALDYATLAASRDRYEYLETTFFLNQMKDLCVNLAMAGYHDDATDMAERFDKLHEKIFAYIFMAEKLYLNQSDPRAFVYLDSALAKSQREDYAKFTFGAGQAIDFRYNLILLLSRIGGKDLNEMSDEFLREIIEGAKSFAVAAKVWGIAEEGNFYRAATSIPVTLTENEELMARAMILWQACRKQENEQEKIYWSSMDQWFMHDFNYVFYLPN